jgi:FtsP/CotA-like multicopper oxidase with cupredoxin domain
VTNVHTHGLHISGESPGDDVTRAFEGQRGGDYVYDIPANHMGGTFWYHAHHHGSTFLQVSTGAFGLIIIDDAEDGIPANVAAMEEKHLLLGYLQRLVQRRLDDQR